MARRRVSRRTCKSKTDTFIVQDFNWSTEIQYPLMGYYYTFNTTAVRSGWWGRTYALSFTSIPPYFTFRLHILFDVATHFVHSNGEVLGVAGLGRRVDQTSEQVEANRASVGSVVLAAKGSVCRVSCPPTEDHPGRIRL